MNFPVMGVDMGTSAIKLVVLDANKNRVYSRFQKHSGSPAACLKTLLSETASRFPKARLGMTGSLAEPVAEKIKKVSAEQFAGHSDLQAQTDSINPDPGVFLLDMVPAVVEGCLAMVPDARCIMEIGAARASFITNFSKKDATRVKFFFNSSCSAGTGSFLEEQAQRLAIPISGLSGQTRLATKVLPIAGRCSVFSKTDMIHFQQDGAKIPDILLGLIHAMVRNYKTNVVKRNPVSPPVFLTGRVMEIHGVRQALAKTFNLSADDFFLEPEHTYANAMGAALAVPSAVQALELSRICRFSDTGVPGSKSPGTARPLSDFGDDDQEGLHPIKTSCPSSAGHLGVDVGSTSTNLVLISPDRQVLHWQYLRTRGTPVETVHSGMMLLKQQMGKDFSLLSIGVTGSGRYLVGKSIGADIVVNEITAQAEGTLFQNPEADTILEIGGQDAKFIRLENQVITDFEMNRVCAAGTGSFLEEQAQKIGVDIRDFGPLSLKSAAPLDLGERCTVFIEGALSKALGRGEAKADIVAGLAYSIVRNYLTRVVGDRSLGDHIFLQGGIAHNQGVVNAFRSLLCRPVTVPPYFSVTGALGMALLSQSRFESGTIGAFSGNPGAGTTKAARDASQNRPEFLETVPDIWARSRDLFLEGYEPNRFPGRPTIGIPRVLFLHKLFVLFNRFFTELGFNVLLSDPTNRDMVNQSRETALEETCYPVKLVNGHVEDLLQKGVDYIFLPRIFTMKHSGSWARKDYGCLYFQTAAKLTEHALNLEDRGVTLLSPQISFKFGTRYIAKTILDLGKTLGKSRLSTIRAMQKAALTFIRYNRSLVRLGKSFLSSIPSGTPVFVVITRPYGMNDPVLNMSVPEHLSAMGYRVMPFFVLEAEEEGMDKDYPNLYWPFAQHILAGARKIRQTPHLFAVYLTNHGCGPDTALLHLFRREMAGKPFLHLEVDEHSSKVGIITRLEAFALSFDKKAVPKSLPDTSGRLLSSLNKDLPLAIPPLFPFSELACAILKTKGIRARTLSPTDSDSLELGKRLSASKEYLSFVSLMGDAKKDAMTGMPGALLIPQTEGAEVEGLYAQVIASLLGDNFPDTRIYAPFLEDAILAPDFFPRFFLPLVAGDIILAGPVHGRKKALEQVIASINDLNTDAVLDLATRTAAAVDPDNLKLLVTGEPAVVFNSFNHQFFLDTVPARICWQPLSEVLYLLWEDWNNRQKDPGIQKHLDLCRQLMIRVARVLGTAGAFEPDPETLGTVADNILPLFSGSNGRYRLAKRFTQTAPHGILEIGSAYENTGIITRQLGDSKSNPIPVLNLVFDGSDHNGNKELLRNFLYYLNAKPGLV
ncbi:CoA activase [Desulfobacter hydrogenophilus]|uniref:CoA activase n=1 Tax=Desulfobacter hydrogenophilus TaxID=2291 RepID=A0A328FEM8_9BACT|nr:acyl-CoA dehydratase activase [Desulfobacter hydrogenophilus]NDY71851.1 CoA activase [Desulfobacter hydrogenophilus]QBH12015.1 CoA activase [Desulfobacter hydrogenophilus]RAM02626.1 CoA activase [Desulfobacter hydrogenophilus]